MPSSELPPPAAPPVRPRRLADRYRLDRCLAIGGMAEVWLGTDEVLDRQVAVKLLHPNLATDDVFVHRLRREAIAVARINHPGIVSVYDTVREDGYEAVVMEYVPGLTLRQVLDDQGTLDVAETVRIGIALADALDAAHAAGIVHRDVKPGNVLVTPEGRVRLTDFGIATPMLADDELGDEGVLLGTAKYVAPEQVEGHLVDGRTDLYALAIVLTECLTGHVPFDGPDERSVALARLRQVPPPVRRARPDVPIALEQLLSSALRTRPSDRPPTAAAFRDALARVPIAPRPLAPAEPREDDPTRRWDATRVATVDRTSSLDGGRPADVTPPLGVDVTTPGRGNGVAPAPTAGVVATAGLRAPRVPGAPARPDTPGADPTTRTSSGTTPAGAAVPVSAALSPGLPTSSGSASSKPASAALGAKAGAEGPLLVTNQRRVTYVVLGIVAAAVLLSVLLLLGAQGGGSVTKFLPGLPSPGSHGASATTSPTTTVRPPNAMAIVGTAEFDPPPGNGHENPDQLGRLTDGRQDTSWSTVCYKQPKMAPKQGVGLVFQLSAPAKGHVMVISSRSQGWAASVYVADSVGPRLSDWGKPASSGHDLGPGDVRLDLGDNDGRFVLLWFTTLGQPGCSGHPYQVRVSEVAVVQA